MVLSICHRTVAGGAPVGPVRSTERSLLRFKLANLASDALAIAHNVTSSAGKEDFRRYGLRCGKRLIGPSEPNPTWLKRLGGEPAILPRRISRICGLLSR
jgi:hypothetical protein